MTGLITGISAPATSINGGNYQFIFFRLKNGKCAKTQVVHSYRNYARWKPIIEAYYNESGKEIILDGLSMKKGHVNADSLFTRFEERDAA